MPRAKAICEKPKTIRCPHCGKKFRTVTNVLQHLNQPLATCYGKPLFEALYDHEVEVEAPTHRSDNSLPLDGFENPQAGIGESPSHRSEDFEEGMEEDVETDVEMDVEMDVERDNPLLHSSVDPVSRQQARFVESFEGCAATFPGGKTFMNTFREDQFAQQRQANLYFPWASKQEWDFASWLLRSRLSMAAIDSLLSLDIIRTMSLSFRSSKELRARAEVLPRGPQWVCKPLKTLHPVKQPVRLFYRDPIECLQALLSHPLFEPHISFVPQKVWTCAAKVCRVYDQWLSGERAWNMQEKLPQGSTLLGVVLSSDKTNIFIMSGNRMAHPLLITLANIDSRIRSKTSLHAYLLLALLPIAKFIHKSSRVRSLHQDRLVHEALNTILAPLKTAATVGVMMSDPVGNLRYCFTPIASWIADTPEESLLAATGPKVSPVTVATSKHFGDARRHGSRTAEMTLAAIRLVCSKHSPVDYDNFLKAIKQLGLNGVVEPFWNGWPLSEPCFFITPEVLHHFHRFAWDHDIQWCIEVVGASELDFRFTLIQTLMGYRAFDEGISKLKQVTGRDHRAVQRYIVGAVAGKAPRRFLIAVRALLDFRYLAQAPVFTSKSLDRVAAALQEFHDNKDAILHLGVRNNWEIPKLELLQSVVPSIQQSGAVMQWSADITEHAHVNEIKEPARTGNNQNYHSQIARHLDRLEKCFRFDLATHIEKHLASGQTDDDKDEGGDEDEDEDHEPDAEKRAIAEYSTPTRRIIDYFAISKALVRGLYPSAPKPFRTFATGTTAFHLATKPSLRMSLGEVALKYELPDLVTAVAAYCARERDTSETSPADWRLQIWNKVRIQQVTYHEKALDSPQTLRAMPPQTSKPYGQYDAVIMSPQHESDWPTRGLEGHSVAQLRVIFRVLSSDVFLAYVQHFRVVPQGGPSNVSLLTGMHLLKRAVRANGLRIGEVIPLTLVRSPAHLIPHFGHEANSHLTKPNSYELSTEFWLNKYCSKELYYALSPTDPC